jgi:hypothetical protein
MTIFVFGSGTNHNFENAPNANDLEFTTDPDKWVPQDQLEFHPAPHNPVVGNNPFVADNPGQAEYRFDENGKRIGENPLANLPGARIGNSVNVGEEYSTSPLPQDPVPGPNENYLGARPPTSLPGDGIEGSDGEEPRHLEGMQNTHMFQFDGKPPRLWQQTPPPAPEEIFDNKLPKPDHKYPLDPDYLWGLKLPEEKKLYSDPESDDMNPLNPHFLWNLKLPGENKPFIVEPEIEEPEFVEFKKPKLDPKEVPLDYAPGYRFNDFFDSGDFRIDPRHHVEEYAEHGIIPRVLPPWRL